jgi:hypothetical protein
MGAMPAALVQMKAAYIPFFEQLSLSLINENP